MSAAAAGGQSTAEAMANEDLILRSPLALSVADPVAHNRRMRPVLSALLVAAEVLDVQVETQFTAGCLLHRYAAVVEDNTEWRWILAACLFLACKTSEDPRRLRDMINVAEMIDWKTDPDVIQWRSRPPDLDDNYWKSKERLVETEQKVLRWLAFDCLVSHPHRAVLAMAESLELKEDDILASWCKLNDCLFHVEALQSNVLALAAAVVNVTCDLEARWWIDFGVDEASFVEAQRMLKAIK